MQLILPEMHGDPVLVSRLALSPLLWPVVTRFKRPPSPSRVQDQSNLNQCTAPFKRLQHCFAQLSRAICWNPFFGTSCAMHIQKSGWMHIIGVWCK